MILVSVTPLSLGRHSTQHSSASDQYLGWPEAHYSGGSGEKLACNMLSSWNEQSANRLCRSDGEWRSA